MSLHILGLVPKHRWYCTADTVTWKANSWQRHPRHAATRWESLFCHVGKWTTPRACFAQASSVWHLFPQARLKRRVVALVWSIKVPSVCLHEGSSTPSVCWHHTHLRPLLWLPSGFGRQGQTSGCHHRNWAFSLCERLAYLILLQGRLHKRQQIDLPNKQCMGNKAYVRNKFIAK